MKVDVREEKGITLISLAVTVIVLLILAGISLNLVLGENGVIKRAKQASSISQKTEEEEKISLTVASLKMANKFSKDKLKSEIAKSLKVSETSIEVYRDCMDNIDIIYYVKNNKSGNFYEITPSGIVTNITELNEKKEKAADQKNSNVIGVAEDGTLVNMDYWKYNKYDTESYTEHSSGEYRFCLGGTPGQEVYTVSSAGYIGPIIDGKIVGKVPKYIKLEGDSQFYRVDSVCFTFAGLNDLTTPPALFDGLVDMNCTFLRDSNLKKSPTIPSSVVTMFGTFMFCNSLEEAPRLPKNLIRMENTFDRCINLKKITDFPNGINDISGVYEGCTNLNDINITIPASVENMDYLFCGCTNLSGIINVKAPSDVKCSKALNNAATAGKGLILKGSGAGKDTIFATKSATSKVTLQN